MRSNRVIAAALAAVFMFCSVPYAAGQENKTGKEKEKAFSIIRTDSLSQILADYLQMTTSKHFEDPRIPRFLIQDRTDHFVFGVGGRVEGKFYYDIGGVDGNGFKLISDDQEPHKNDLVNMSLSSTTLQFKVLGKTKRGVIDAYITADFSGTDGTLKLGHAYVDVFGLRIGQTDSGFRDDESINLVDGGGHFSGTSRKVPQVSYSYRFKNGIRLQGGVELPNSATYLYKGRVEPLSQAIISDLKLPYPDLTVNMYYTGEKCHFYAGVLGRVLKYYCDMFDGMKGYYSGSVAYGLQLGSNFYLAKTSAQSHRIFLQGVWSDGVNDCLKILRKKGQNLVIPVEAAAPYEIPKGLGGQIGYQVRWNNSTVNLQYSVVKVSGYKNAHFDELFDWGHSATVNYMLKFLKYGTVGAEAVAGRSWDLGGRGSYNFRGYIFIRYDF